MKRLAIDPLSQKAFAGFGDVITAEGTTPKQINQGYAQRFNDLANIDVTTGDGSTSVSVFQANKRPFPIKIELMEHHPLGSQLFYPLQNEDWLIVVCADPQHSDSYKAFRAAGNQGVNYAPGIWHHPLLVLRDGSSFLVVDRKGPGNNLVEVSCAEPLILDI